MENKEDWDKLRVWQQKKEHEKKQELEARSHPHKGMQEDHSTRISYFLKDAKEFIVMHLDLLFLVFITIVACGLLVVWKMSTDVKVDEYFEGRYQEGMILLSETEEINGNEKRFQYVLALERNEEIKFHAKRFGGSWEDDLKNRELQYYFETWDSSFKEQFEVKQEEEESLLVKYELAFPIDQYEEIGQGLQALREFGNYVGEQIETEWNVFIQKDDLKLIDLQWLQSMTEEEAEQEARKIYVNNSQAKKVQEAGITEEVLEKYWKPDFLTVELNGKPILDSNGNAITMKYHEDGYQLFLNQSVLKNISGVTKIEKNQEGMETFLYRGKKYTIGSGEGENLLENPLTEWDLVQIFGATVKHDYSEEKIKIVIP